MSDYAEHEPMPVTRVHTANGSHIEPPLDQGWDNLTKLRWHAGVVLVDSGVRTTIIEGSVGVPSLFGRTRWLNDTYSIGIGHGSTGGFTYAAAWDFLNGVSDGARAAREPQP